MESNACMDDTEDACTKDRSLKLMEKSSSDGVEISIEDDGDYKQTLAYTVEEVPPPGILISIAFQNMLLSLGAVLSTTYAIGDIICAPPDHPVRAKLFCTTLLMSGICTTFQPLIGVRLPIFQGVSSTFLVPLMAMRDSPGWKCPGNSVPQEFGFNASDSNNTLTTTSEDAMYARLQEMMGCLMLSSLSEVIVGAFGLIGFLMRYIGPLTVATVVSLIGLSLYKIPMEYARVHWGLFAMYVVICILMMMYLDRVRLPIPVVRCRRRKGQSFFAKVPIFQIYPVLISMLITWLVCGILTATNTLSNDPASLEYRARTDVRQNIIRDTPWFYLPHPGQFGSPKFNTAIFIGFIAAVISSVLESVGDYFAAAHIARAPPPPIHAVNRGILLEGIGSVLSGAMGAGHATTSWTCHIALLGISKVASRYCMVASGVVCIVVSVVGKIGAVLSTMPDPPIGGAMFILFSILTPIGIFTLKSIDLSSSRNIAVFGISLYAGIVIPAWFAWYPESVMSGNETVDGVVKGLFGTPMFLGGIVAFFLDNTVRGTRKERGFLQATETEATAYVTSERDTYSMPFIYWLMKRCRFLEKLPFIQPYGNEVKDDGQH